MNSQHLSTAGNSLNAGDGIRLHSTGSASYSALTKEGRVHMWGFRSDGLAGDGRTLVLGTEPANVVPSLNNIVQLSGGSHYIHGLSANGDLYGWGNHTWGALGAGEIGYVVSTPRLIMQDAVQVAHNCNSSFALDKVGNVWGWGYNFGFELATDYPGIITTPAPIFLNGDKARLLSSSYSGTLAVTKNGHVWGWGRNFEASLGLSTADNPTNTIKVKTPTRITNLEPYADRIVQIGLGFAFGAALLDDGRVIGWGRQIYLGLNKVAIDPMPVEMMNNVVKMHIRLNGGALLTRDGAVFTWGIDTRYGLPMLAGAEFIQRLPAGSATDIGGGCDNLFYKTVDGKVYGLGYNFGNLIEPDSNYPRIGWPGVEIQL